MQTLAMILTARACCDMSFCFEESKVAWDERAVVINSFFEHLASILELFAQDCWRASDSGCFTAVDVVAQVYHRPDFLACFAAMRRQVEFLKTF